jgi:hypothetical protein
MGANNLVFAAAASSRALPTGFLTLSGQGYNLFEESAAAKGKKCITCLVKKGSKTIPP